MFSGKGSYADIISEETAMKKSLFTRVSQMSGIGRINSLRYLFFGGNKT